MSSNQTSHDANTRETVHVLAEHVLAAELWSRARTIRLVVTAGGLATRPLPGDPGGVELVRDERHGAVVRRLPDGDAVPVAGTVGELAGALGVRFGIADPPYHVTTTADPDRVAELDPAAFGLLVQAWQDGDRALRAFAAAAAGPDGGGDPVVWPEHLDVAITLDGVNYGVSPGDGFISEPYAYVGPHGFQPSSSAASEGFWNAPFGAARPMRELDGADGVRGFFDAGREASRP
jgi:hypothetical protein